MQANYLYGVLGPSQSFLKKSLFAVAVILALVIAVIYLTLDVMVVDTAQYASIAQEMYETGEWLQVQHEGRDYLDKPPLLFWMSAMSFVFLGVSNLAFKLPALLMSVMGAYATFRLARRFYSPEAARWAGMMLFTCVASFLLVNNVLTDSLLVGSVALATWTIVEYTFSKKWYWLFGGGLGLALAMLAKGPIGLMVPVLALSTHWILRKEWKWFFHWKWLVLIALVGVLLSPMLWGLYQQHGSYGPYFYFWEQSFGRLTGQNAFIQSIEQAPPNDPTFFIHTFLWSFLPWSLIGLIALGAVLFGTIARKWRMPEYLSLGGVLLPAIALSFSGYKLPHYLYVTYPFMAMLLAGFLEHVINLGFWKTLRTIRWVQGSVAVLLVIAGAALVAYSFPGASWWVWSGSAVIMAFMVLSFWLKDAWSRLLAPALFAMLSVQWLLATQAYPVLFKYQSGAQAGQWKTEHSIPNDRFFGLHQSGHDLNFYADKIVHPMDAEAILAKADSIQEPIYVFTDRTGIESLQARTQVEVLQSFEDFRIAFMNWRFLDPGTREQVVTTKYLVRIVPE